MANIRKINEIILSLIDFYRTQQPEMDTKPGEVSRDLFIDGPSSAISLLYDELGQISNVQSIRTALGSDLDNLLKNYGITRKSPTKSSGVGILTFNSINSPIVINKTSSVFASNGIAFNIVTPLVINANQANYYKSVASKYKNDLDFLGIQDQYALEVTLESSTAGLNSNIAKYGLSRTSISGITNVTNVTPFSGGSNQEDDTTFRNRGLSVFGGTATGTELGYKNLALSQSDVLDTVVITPGDSLMTRDGTVVSKNTDGSYTILSEGAGGKVDIIILGKSLAETSYSYIYSDKSNYNDPTDTKNNIVLGLSTSDLLKTVNKRRIDALTNNTGIPQQPVNSIVSVSGSSSGSNFVEKAIDSLGRVTGNFEMLKDTSVYAGSPWGFDTFKWINNKVTLFPEDRVKTKFNGQDNLSFTDVLNISNVTQNVSITNENSNVLSGKTSIQLLHYPCMSVTRVFNTNTGERYTVTNQNPDGTGSINNTGRITISGNTLPAISDILQVDYTWVNEYDCYSDFDGRIVNNNPRSVTDSIDWGLSNAVRSERVSLALNTSSTFYTCKVLHPISSIIKVNTFRGYSSLVEIISSGIYSGRLGIYLNNLVTDVTTIDSIKLKYTNYELFATDLNDGTFISTRVVVGLDIRYNILIVLPTDTIANNSDYCDIVLDKSDIFNISSATGTFTNNQINIPATNFTGPTTTTVLVDYIANTTDIISTNISSFPLSRLGNNFNSSSTGFLNNYTQNTFIHENATVVQSGLDYYLDLTLQVTDNILTTSDIVSVVRISDGLELWDKYNVGTVTTPTSVYRLTLTGFNTPVSADKCLVIYKSDSLKKTQPSTFVSSIINYNIFSANYDSGIDGYYIPMQEFIAASGISFTLSDGYSDNVYATGTDGYLELNYALPFEADFSSLTTDFSIIDEVSYKTLKISAGILSDNGIYDIVSFNSSNNKFRIRPTYNNLSKHNVCVIRLKDNKEVFNDTCTLDYTNNKIIIPNTGNILFADKLILLYIKSEPVKQCSSKLQVTLLDQVTSFGSIVIDGTTLNKTTQLFTCTNNGSIQNVSEALRKALKKNSSYSIPSTYKLARIVKLEKVDSVGEEVISVLATYNVTQSRIKNSIVYSNHIEDVSLSNLDFKITESLNIGDVLRITFYYTLDEREIMYFTRNGTYYSTKQFLFINKIFTNSGFVNTSSLRFVFSFMNQPITNSRYKAYYDYTAPKQNERIFIRYNYNKLISDVTTTIENNRPVSADVIVKEAVEIPVNVQMNIVTVTNTTTPVETIRQNVLNKISSALSSSQLGTIIDASDLVNIAYGVTGVDRARVVIFNKDGETGQVLSLTAQKNEYFSANTISVVLESR